MSVPVLDMEMECSGTKVLLLITLVAHWYGISGCVIKLHLSPLNMSPCARVSIAVGFGACALTLKV